MSETTPTPTPASKPKGRPARGGLLFKSALFAGLLACLLVAGYIARTSPVVGTWVRSHLSAVAHQQGIDLTVNTMRPAGLTGLRLEQVQVVARRGSYLIEADLDAVDIRPSLRELFAERRLHPSSAEVDGGRILVTRKQSAQTSKEDEPEAASGGEETGARSGTVEPTGDEEEPAARAPVRSVLRDVSVSVKPAPLPGTTRPLTFHRAELALTSTGKSGVEFEHGYGTLPDDTPFAVRKQRSDDSNLFVIEPEAPTRLDQWFGVATGMRASVGAISVCPECEPAEMELLDVHLEGFSDLKASAEEVSLGIGRRELRSRMSEIDFERAGRRVGYRLRHLEAVYDTATLTAILQGDLVDEREGNASFAVNWSGQWGVLEVNAAMRDFDTSKLWEELGVERRIEGGRWTGRLETNWEPAVDLAEMNLDLDTEELTIEVPLVAEQPLDFEKLGLRVDTIVQPFARTISISDGEATLGGATPIAFNGYGTDADGGWVFDVQATADKLDAQKLRDGLPPSLTEVARETKFDGEFGFDVSTAGHTAYPDELLLAVDFWGEVEVDDEPGFADLLALAADGPPSSELPGALAHQIASSSWIDYDSLPPHIPRVLTAAEDARFFSHDGFDWKGLRRAMVHNVRAGRVLRGGSTLSQQLSKNLFLNHQRTLARKFQEAYVTWRLEQALSKERILELYMNLVDWGPNVRGIGPAANHYFGVDAPQLTIPQMALMAALLPGPSIFGRQIKEGYLPSSRLEKFEHILSNLRFLDVISAVEYERLYEAAGRGQVAGLELEVCDDDGEAPRGAPECP